MSRYSGWITALLVTSAAAAAWAMAAITLDRPLAPMVFALALAAVWGSGECGLRRPLLRGLLALGLCLAGSAYALTFDAAASLRRALGVPLWDAIGLAGPQMLLAIADARLHGAAKAVLGLGQVAAFGLAWVAARRSR